MDEKKAMAFLPEWSKMPVQNGEMKMKPQWEDILRRFAKRYGIAILVVLALWMYGWAVALVTEHKVRIAVEEELTHYWRGQMQAALDEKDRQQMAASLLTGEASLQAAIDQEAEPLARYLNGYITKGNATTARAKTAGWCVIARTDSPNYPSTIQGVIEQAKQWQFYDANAPIRQTDLNLAKELLTMWHQGRYPDGLTSDFVYMEWSSSDIVLRNKWEKDSTTAYWRYPDA